MVAMLVTGCRDFKRHVKSIVTYPTTAEEIADVADLNESDAALVVTVADTQYVLYRKNSGERCYAMRYVSQHRCKHDFSGRGGTFLLGEPEQAVALTRTGDNALTLTIDSLIVAVTDIVATDSMLTFRFGVEDPDREATLYLYGKARGTKDVFAETSIQQILVLSMSLDAMLEDMGETGTEESTETTVTADERYAEYSRMDSIAVSLGFTDKKATATDDRIELEVSGYKGESKDCNERMKAMSEAAKSCHCKNYSVEHVGPNHRKCKFTIEW